MLSDRTLAQTFGMPPRTIALWGDAVRAISVAIVALVLAALTGAYAHALRRTIEIRDLQDFGVFYDAAARARGGGDLYRAPADTGRRVRPVDLNPPHFHFLLWPLTAVSPTSAFATWVALSSASLAASLAVISRTLQLGPWGITALAALIYALPATFATAMTGQVGAILLLPYTLAWRHARRGQEITSAIWLGVCASLKPLFLLFVPALGLRARWSAAFTVLATALALFAAGVIAFGLEPHRDWVNNLLGVTWAEHYMNASLLGLIERSLSAGAWRQRPFADAPWLVAPLWSATAGAIAGATLWKIRRVADPDRQFLLVTSAAFLVSPLGWIYYLWLLVPPLSADLASSRARRPGPRWVLLVALAGLLTPLPLVLAAQTWGAGGGTLTLGSVYCWALIAIWIAAWWD